jgi:hypothetical protein
MPLICTRALVALGMGERPKHVVNNRIKELQQARDEAGVRTWSRVADQLTRLSRESLPRHHFFD